MTENEEARELESLKASICSSHRTAGTVQPEPESAVRAKAYELWLAGGMSHGRDVEDWIRAKEILSRHNQTSGEVDPAPPSIAQTMVEGVLGAAHLAVNAAASAINNMLGSVSAEPKTPKPEPDPPTSAAVPDAALDAAERKLRIEADKRVRDAKTGAAGTTASEADVSKAKINPDG
jgi:Protein of unknown function (DUF2934)